MNAKQWYQRSTWGEESKSRFEPTNSKMGSASAAINLTSHPHLNTFCCLKRLDSIRSNQQTTLQLTNSRKPKLRLGYGHRQLVHPVLLRRVNCSAVEDDLRVTQPQQESSIRVGPTVEDRPAEADALREGTVENIDQTNEGTSLYNFLYPDKELLPDDEEMSIFDHLEELRQRIFVSVLAVGAAISGCFVYSKELIMVLEAPVKTQGVRFLQLAPGEFFFTTLKVSGYCGLLIGSPVILYEIIAFIIPGLTRAERRFLGPIVLSSSVLFYAGIIFSYMVLTPAALNFFVSYAEGVVESLWSIDQYFEFVLILMFSTGLSFQVPVIQLLLGQTGLVSSDQMLSIWRYVVVGAVVAAAILTPSTDPLTQMLLAGPLLGLYLGGAWAVKLTGR